MGEISCRGAVAVWDLPAAPSPLLSHTQNHPVPAVPAVVPAVVAAVVPAVLPDVVKSVPTTIPVTRV